MSNSGGHDKDKIQHNVENSAKVSPSLSSVLIYLSFLVFSNCPLWIPNVPHKKKFSQPSFRPKNYKLTDWKRELIPATRPQIYLCTGRVSKGRNQRVAPSTLNIFE